MLSSPSSFSSGVVCVCGGLFLILSLIIFFCVRISGFMYSLFGSSVPHTVTDPMRCGYTWV